MPILEQLDDDSLQEEASETNAPRLDTTLVKGFNVLAALCRSRAPMGISALSDELSIGRSNVHRLLMTLIELGYVRREDKTRRYSATLKIWEQGAIVVDRSRFRRGARPHLLRLMEDVGHAIILSVLSGTDILYLDKIETMRSSQTPSRAGLRVPAIFPATGKALLAFQSNTEELIRTICESAPEAAILRPEMMLEECRQIRRDGYATSVNGWTSHYCSVAVPIPCVRGYPRASLGIGVALEGFDPRQLPRFVPSLAQTASLLGDLLGEDEINL